MGIVPVDRILFQEQGIDRCQAVGVAGTKAKENLLPIWQGLLLDHLTSLLFDLEKNLCGWQDIVLGREFGSFVIQQNLIVRGHRAIENMSVHIAGGDQVVPLGQIS
jgi:hypothetical protein